jgi:hypothetical protein
MRKTRKMEDEDAIRHDEDAVRHDEKDVEMSAQSQASCNKSSKKIPLSPARQCISMRPSLRISLLSIIRT